MRRSGLPLATSSSRANNTPCQTPLCPKRRPPRPQQPIFSVFYRGGLHFERRTTTNRDLTITKRGNFATRGSDTSATRHQKASYRKTPPAPVRRLPEGQAAVPVGGGRAWPGFETTRRAKLAARTASGRAAAHRHTQRPGPTKQAPRRPKICRDNKQHKAARPLGSHQRKVQRIWVPSEPRRMITQRFCPARRAGAAIR